MRTIRYTLLTVVTAVVASVAACATGAEPAGPNTTTTTRTTEPTARGAPPGVNSGAPSATSTSSGTGNDAFVDCRETRDWDTNDETAKPYSTDALYLVRVGRHDCYDRVVLDINGPAEAGYLVHYVPVVTADGSGEPIPVAGTAALAVITHAPPLGFDDSGHQPGTTFADLGDHLHTPTQLTGWRSLRAVRFAGYFEGQSTLALGVSRKLPFRVTTQLDRTDQIRRIVIDIAHDR